MIDLDELERLREKATPGPWRRSEQATRSGGYRLPWPSMLGEDGAVVVGWSGFDGTRSKAETKANIALIAAAVNALGPLIEEVKRLRGALEEIADGNDDPNASNVARAALDGGGE